MIDMLKKNKINIILFIFIILFNIFCFKGCIKLKTDFTVEQQIGIITINSIITGFLFSGLSLLVSNSDRPRLKRLEDQGYLDDYYNGIYLAMLFNMISLIISVMFMTEIFSKGNITIMFEQIALYSSLLFYVKTLIVLISFPRKIRNK